MKTGIIGGGYTGLVAALRLAQAGHNVTIFEKNGDLGGLAGGFKIHGSNLEKTYHHLFKTDKSILNLVKELGIHEKLLWTDSSVAIYYDNEIYPFGNPVDLLRFSPLNLFDRLRLGMISFFLQKTKDWEKLENMSAYEWMEYHAGKSATEVIWKPLLKGKFHKFYKEVSMAWLWARLHVRGNSRDSIFKEKLGYFEGGFQTFTDRLIEELDKLNVEIELNSPVDQIKKIDSQFPILDSEFDKVLFTGPSHIFAKLIQGNDEIEKEYVAKLNSIKYLGAVVGIFSSDQKLGDYYWYNINDLDKPFLIFVNHTNLINKAEYSGNYVYYIGGYYPHEHAYFDQTKEEIFEEWFTNLKDIFEDFDLSKVDERHMFKFKNAQHVADLDYASKIPDYETPVKNLYLANFSQIYPEDRGTNYAVREGEKIAKIVMS